MDESQFKKVLNTLDDDENNIRILYWFCDRLNEKQIALRVDPQEGTIRSRLHRISEKMECVYVLRGY